MTTIDLALLQQLQQLLTNGGTFTMTVDPVTNGEMTIHSKIEVKPVPLPPLPPVPPVPPVPPPVPVPVPVPVPPPAFVTTTHPMAVPVTLHTAAPYPTNAWWQNIILGKNRISPDPYQIQVVDNGVLVCYPMQAFSQDSFGMQHVTTQWLENFSLEFAENMGSWGVIAYDDLTVTLKWVAQNGNTANTVIAQGCPYMTMGYTNLTPLLTTQHAIMSVNSATTPGMVTGNKLKVVLNNGQVWTIYTSATLTFAWTQQQIMATTPFSGVVRLAVLGSSSDEATLDSYVAAIPVGGSVSTNFTNGHASYSFSWKSVGSGALLMCALPHHLDILQSPQSIAFHRQSIKGIMTGIVGQNWVLNEPLSTIGWTASKPINAAYLPAIAAQLKQDATFTSTNTSDTYYSGKEIAKLARLLLIAQEIGDTDSMAIIVKNLKSALSTWLDRTDLFAYDKTWCGLVFAPALHDKGADFGYSWYNDHLFHGGYFAYGAAVLGKFDAQWLATYKEKITEIVHDYCNPLGSNDTRYPVIRNKDMWAGHSWAAGLFDFADNRNLESTSEAINGYYGAMLWGLVTGDTALQNFAGLMMTSEIRSAKKYWHVYSGNNVYGSQWTANGVGISWSCKQDDSTWFGANLEYRRMIQVLPVTPVTELYVQPAWVQAMQSSGELDRMLSQAAQEWRGFVLATLAVVDPAKGWQGIDTLTAFDNGNSRTNLMHWVATR